MAEVLRKEVREAVAALIRNNLPSGLVATTYAYKVGDFRGVSPVVAVVSSRGRVVPNTLRSQLVQYTFEVHTFVLYADAANAWTEQDAENLMDNLYDAIMTILYNRELVRSLKYDSIEQSDASLVREVKIGGVQYLNEVTPITVTIM